MVFWFHVNSVGNLIAVAELRGLIVPVLYLDDWFISALAHYPILVLILHSQCIDVV